MQKVLAGLDVDGFVKLFLAGQGNAIYKVSQEQWLGIIDELGFLQPGEMPVVSFSKETPMTRDALFSDIAESIGTE